MAYEIEDLPYEEENAANIGGMAGSIYAARPSWIKTLPEPVDAADGGLTVTTAIVMETGKKFIDIYATRNSAGFEEKPAGELDGKSWEQTLSWFHPKIREGLLKVRQAINNGPWIFLAKDANGLMRIVGSKDLPAYSMEGAMGPGTEPKSRNGANFNVQAASGRPALIYTGPIPLTPSV
ncbi:hypothetical protein [Hymenobacter sp. BT190]|uniref:hypothetical protein n=1 Tax=Hymenobacter sp. BT190 TaxID=2763505 RepID=UPI0016517D37|nr:hypothetical protein [Hymenobacter sp. BT190]MBC6698069.1 hypothetical protein [Hymenobacter sp. BT190]